MIRHYVQFFYPGVFLAEDSSREITEEEPFDGKFPDNCYAYRFFDREEVKGTTGKLTGSAINYSGMHFKGGAIYTLEEVKKAYPKEKILISNMEANKWPLVVKTALGNWQPFDPDKDSLMFDDV